MKAFHLGAAALAALSAIPTLSHADPSSTGWALVFNDDFSGTTVDTSRWHYRIDAKTTPSNGMITVQKAENVSVANGVMNVALTRNANPDGSLASYSGGGLVSKQTFRYGYYEARVKINTSPGWHTSFWLQAGNGQTTFPPERRTEIDVFELNSANASAGQIRHNVIRWNPNGSEIWPRLSFEPYNSGEDLTQWHTYAVEWNEQGTTYYIDGSPFFKAGTVVEGQVMNGTQPRYLAYPPSQHKHDKLAIWLTTIAYGDYWPNRDLLPDAVQFDYVRYWQKDYYLDTSTSAPGEYVESGTWMNSALTGWTKDSPSRYGSCNVAGIQATWTPTLQQAGTYQVFAYNVVHSASDPNQRFDVAGLTTVVNGTQGSSGWVSLGTFTLPAGNGTSVVQTSSGTGCARAAAVKFVRVG